MRRVRTLAGGRIRFCDSEYGETTASCMLRRFETLLMAHTFVETTVNFTLGDVLHMEDAGKFSGALTDSFHPCLVRDPVDFPGLAPIIREGLLKVGRIRGDIRPNKSNQD